jgi:GT2 family glycosyltransferase
MISVVLVNWNGWHDTLACVQSLLNSSSGLFRIIVVDNSSSDQSLEAFKSWSRREFELIPRPEKLDGLSVAGRERRRDASFGRYNEAEQRFEGFDVDTPDASRVYFIESGRNGGFGFGCNVGLRLGRQLGSSGYWLLNNDCVVKPDTLATIAARLERRPDCVFGTVLRYYSRPDTIQVIGGGFFNSLTSSATSITKHEQLRKQLRKLNFINGASMIFSDRCLKDTGYFDERIFMYFEENDFCIRARAAGYCFDVVETDVFHKHGGSQGGGASVGAWTNVLINRHYVSKKHLGWGPWIFFFYATLLVRSLLPIGEKNARLGARRAFKRLLSRSALP